ncbi:MAG: ribonuclease P protein component [bacterium]|nr:ribonuclease P protein component [bacterium]
MLPKIHRLIKNFNSVFKKGRKLEGCFIWLKFIKNNLGVSRFGFAVGMKISKKAVERNKIKRRLRAASYAILKSVGEPVGYDIAIIAKPEIKKEKLPEIIRDLKILIKKFR